MKRCQIELEFILSLYYCYRIATVLMNIRNILLSLKPRSLSLKEVLEQYTRRPKPSSGTKKQCLNYIIQEIRSTLFYQ